jgi:hypothetical protein
LEDSIAIQQSILVEVSILMGLSFLAAAAADKNPVLLTEVMVAESRIQPAAGSASVHSAALPAMLRLGAVPA